jgi:hypothetical protein
MFSILGIFINFSITLTVYHQFDTTHHIFNRFLKQLNKLFPRYKENSSGGQNPFGRIHFPTENE